MSQADIAGGRLTEVGRNRPPDVPSEFEDPYLGNAIDWQAAAPSWWGILAGLVFPGVLALALLVLADIALSALLHAFLLRGISTWQLAIVLPVACLCVVAVVKRL